MRRMIRLTERDFKSKYDIGDLVKFKPMARHMNQWSLTDTYGTGTITAVRFSNAKVFYDIVDEYYGFLFDNVDSIYVMNKINTKWTK